MELPGQDDERNERQTRTPRAKLKPSTTEGNRKNHETKRGQLEAVGKLLPACPMSPDELAEAWSVAADDAETITVKIQRYVVGTKELELVDSLPLTEFSGERVAGRFGPGNYYLRPAAGPYARHAAKLPISEALARNCGYGRIAPSAQDLVAERTIRQATTGPTDPLDLVAAIEQVMDKRDRERGIMPMPVVHGVAQADPMKTVETQMSQMMKMMEMIEGLNAKARETVRAEMGIIKPEAVEPSEGSFWIEMVKSALPTLVELIANRNPAPPVQAAPPPPMVVNPEPQPEPQPQGGPTMPQLTPQEQSAIAGAVAMLRPFAGQLVAMAKQTAGDGAIVAELEPFIPGGLVPSLADLAGVVATHGPAVLAGIHPDLATARWAGILPELVKACEA